MPLRHPLTLLGCMVVLASAALCQPAYHEFDYLSIEDGLSQSSVHCTTQDRQGYMWFGTEDGLNRFDGYRFTAFRHQLDDTSSLAENYVSSLFVDSRGILWAGTKKGLDAWDDVSQTFRHALQRRECTAIGEDASGGLWVGTDSGIVRFDPIRQTMEWHVPPLIEGNVISRRIISLLVDTHGSVWVGREMGGFLTRLDIRTGVMSTYKIPDIHDVWAIIEEESGNLLLATYYSDLYRFDRSLDRVVRSGLIIPGPRATRGVWTMCRDREGTIWFGTVGSGLCSLPRNANSMTTYTVRDNYVLSIYEDRSGLLWVGTGKGINKMVAKRRQFNRVPHQLDMQVRDLEVWSICSAGSDSLWIGANNGLYLLGNDGGIADGRAMVDCIAQSLVREPSGALWIGSMGKGLLRWDPATRTARALRMNPSNPRHITADDIRSMAMDSSGTLWLGTADGLCAYSPSTQSFLRLPGDSVFPAGLRHEKINFVGIDQHDWLFVGASNGFWRMNSRTGAFRQLVNEPGNPSSLSDSRVMTALRTGPEIIWIGTYGGLDCFDTRTGTIRRFTHLQGLPNDVVYGILPDEQGCLWLSTNKGLAKFDPATETFRTYDVSDGLQSDEFDHGAYFKDSRGRLYFGGVSGFNAFDPREITDSQLPPPIVFTDFRVFDRSMNLLRRLAETGVVELSYAENFISVEFAALDYTCPQKNRYAYKLEGFDREWIACGTRRYAAYTNLDGGTYVFHIRGSNSDGAWSPDGASFTIRIIPPFWRTWWFYTATGILLASVIAGYVSWRFALLRRRAVAQQEMSRQILESQENERKRIGASLHDSLGQNLLIIKNLATLGLSALHEQRSSEQSLTEISTLASGALAEVREISYNLRPYQIDRLGLTGALRSIMTRVAAASAITYEVDMDNVDGLISKHLEINAFRIVQEAINNIVRHSQARHASVTIKRDASAIHITVRDDGTGFDAGHRGFGLTSMAERTRILSGTLTVRSQPGEGTQLDVAIPIMRDTP